MISNCSVVFPSAESRALYVNELLHRAHEPCGVAALVHRPLVGLRLVRRSSVRSSPLSSPRSGPLLGPLLGPVRSPAPLSCRARSARQSVGVDSVRCPGFPLSKFGLFQPVLLQFPPLTVRFSISWFHICRLLRVFTLRTCRLLVRFGSFLVRFPSCQTWVGVWWSRFCWQSSVLDWEYRTDRTFKVTPNKKKKFCSNQTW